MRGHLRHITLAGLAEKEMSGYDLMMLLESKTGKKPSPGSIYPLLSEMQDAGLIKVRDEGRKKIYSLTPSGKKEAHKASEAREEILDSMERGAKMCMMLEGEEAKMHSAFIESIRKGDSPFGKLTPEVMELKKLTMRLAIKGAFSKHEDRIREILAKAIKELKGVESR